MLKLQIVVLNTNLMKKSENDDDAIRQWEWLEKVLSKFQRNGEVVSLLLFYNKSNKESCLCLCGMREIKYDIITFQREIRTDNGKDTLWQTFHPLLVFPIKTQLANYYSHNES